jgi:N-methylhydantoinase A
VPVRVPIIDIHTIGSGGGSIARISRAGMLQVGPESAGAIPGSICYGRGGQEPTVTDANLLLGRINPIGITGVEHAIDVDAVPRGIEQRIARPLGLDVHSAAAAIITVANNQMAAAIRLVSIEKGYDPRDFCLFAFGGAGPLHAVSLARELDIPSVLIPRFPGITSALGCVLADVRHDFVQHINRRIAKLSGREVDEIFADHRHRGSELIARERVAVEEIDAVHEVDILYEGQIHIFRLPVASPGFDPHREAREFAQRYRERFDIELLDIEPVVTDLRTTVYGRRAKFNLSRLSSGESKGGKAGSAGRRPVYFNGTWHESSIYHRAHLLEGQRIAGPAIVEQMDTTIVIEPGSTAIVDRIGNIIIRVGPAS